MIMPVIITVGIHTAATKSLQSFSISCVNLTIARVTQLCPKLKHKVLFMLYKYGAMVASQQTIYGKKATIIISIATLL